MITETWITMETEIIPYNTTIVIFVVIIEFIQMMTMKRLNRVGLS